MISVYSLEINYYYYYYYCILSILVKEIFSETLQPSSGSLFQRLIINSLCLPVELHVYWILTKYQFPDLWNPNDINRLTSFLYRKIISHNVTMFEVNDGSPQNLEHGVHTTDRHDRGDSRSRSTNSPYQENQFMSIHLKKILGTSLSSSRPARAHNRRIQLSMSPDLDQCAAESENYLRMKQKKLQFEKHVSN